MAALGQKVGKSFCSFYGRKRQIGFDSFLSLNLVTVCNFYSLQNQNKLKFDKNQLIGLKIATTEESRKRKPLDY